MAKHIGIVACSAEGAALCYRTICSEAPSKMGEHMHPEVSMHTHALGEYMVPIRKGDWEKVADLMLSSTQKVSQIGAEFAICPDNTIHEAFDFVKLDDLSFFLIQIFHNNHPHILELLLQRHGL